MMRALVLAMCVVCATASVGGAGTINPAPLSRPGWIDAAPAPTPEYVFVVGQSGASASEIDARTAAERDAIRQIADYVGVQINLATNETRSRNSPAELGHVQVDGRSVTHTLSDAFISRLRHRDRYCEQTRVEKTGQPFWGAWVLTEVPRVEMERAIQAMRTRRHRARTRFGLYSNGAVVYQSDPSLPYFTDVRNLLERHLSKFGVAIFNRQPDSGPALPVLNVSGRVNEEKTIYDQHFIAAHLVLRVQHTLPDGTVVTEHVVAGTRRAYASTVVTVLESAVESFLDNLGPELLNAVRGE